MRVTWEDGRLAAKQLFDALKALGHDPVAHRYLNVFHRRPTGPETVNRAAVRRVRAAARAGLTVVAMGQKVTAVLTRARVTHLTIVHPAARGKIRKKSRYTAHLRKVLT